MPDTPTQPPALALALTLLLTAVVLASACTTTSKANRYDDVPTDIPDSATTQQREIRALKIMKQAQAAMIGEDMRRAVELFKKALVIYKDIDDFSAQAAIHNDLGLILNAAREHDRAIELLQKALALSERGDEKIVGVEAQYNIGVVHSDARRDSEAEAAYTRSLEMAQTIKSDEMIGLALNGRGNVRRRQNNLAPAIEDYRGALKSWNHLERGEHAAVALQNIGYTYVLMAKHDEAAVAFQNAIDAFGNIESPDKAILVPHLEELVRLVRTDTKAAREKVMRVLGR